MSDSNRIALSYVAESTFGVTPSGPPTLKDLRFTGESLVENTQTVLSAEIRSDRQNTDVIRTSIGASGDINFELSYGAYDDFLQAAMLSAGWSTLVSIGPLTTISFSSLSPGLITRSSGSFVTDGFLPGQWIIVSGSAANSGQFKVTAVSSTQLILATGTTVEAAGPSITIKQSSQIVNGTTLNTYAIEKKFTDLTNIFAIFNGMAVQTLALDVGADKIVTGSLGFIGKKETSATATAGTGTNTAPPTGIVMEGVDHVKPVQEGPYPSYAAIGIISASIRANNNLRTRLQVGTLGAISIGTGSIDVTGTLQMYFQDAVMMNKYLNQTAASLAMTFNDGTNSYLIEFPQLKYTAGKRVAGGKNQDIIADMAFTAYRHAGENVTMRIVRT